MQDFASDSAAKYRLKINKDGKDYEEKIDVDIEKGTETFHVSKTAPDEEAGDIIYDFKKNLTMIRLPEAKSCFMSDGTDDVPKPTDLVKLLVPNVTCYVGFAAGCVALFAEGFAMAGSAVLCAVTHAPMFVAGS
ncbi:hypothetical protein ACROYT_G019751 [Oculina patagonica]